MKNLIFQYPAWWALACVALGLAYAAVLYYREKTFKDQPRYLVRIMAVLRFLLVTLLSLLLLSPLLRSLLVETQKPVIVVAQDASESVGATMNAAQRKTYDERLSELQDALKDDFEVKPYSFGSEVREGVDTAFNDKISNISKLLSNVYDLYGSQNLGAIVLATDGIYNEGSNPLYASSKLTAHGIHGSAGRYHRQTRPGAQTSLPQPHRVPRRQVYGASRYCRAKLRGQQYHAECV
jgi:hypothetical protein